MSRKRNHRMRRVKPDPRAIGDALNNSLPPQPDEVQRVMNDIRAAYQRLKDGVGNLQDATQLGVMLNVGFVRAQAIGKPLADAFEEGGNAMRECERLQERHGKYGFTGQGLLQMNAALDLYEQVLAMSSLNQMAAAGDAAFCNMREHALKHQGATA